MVFTKCSSLPATGATSVIGSWTADGRTEDAVTLLAGVRAKVSSDVKINYAKGCDVTGDSRVEMRPTCERPVAIGPRGLLAKVHYSNVARLARDIFQATTGVVNLWESPGQSGAFPIHES